MPEPLFTRRFFGLWAFAFITFFSAFQLLPAVPYRIIELGGSKAAAGWFLSVYTFSSAFAAPIMGSIADHVGRKRLLMLASLLFTIFSILYGVITIVPVLLLVALVHGALWSGLMSSSSAIMSEFIPESRRTEGLAYWGLASTAAFAVGPMAGFLIFKRGGWMVLCAELAVLSVVMAFWSSQLPVEQPHAVNSLPPLRDSWDWRVVKPAMSMAVIAFGYGGMTSYVALLSDERGIRPASLYFTVFAVTIVVFRLAFARFGDRFGPTRMLYPAFVAVPISFAILAGAETRAEMIVSGALFGLGMGGAWPAFTTFILTRTDQRRRARTFGSIVWAFDTGIGLGSLLIGAIGQRYGLGRGFAVAAAISCLAIPIFVMGSRELGVLEAPVSSPVRRA
jgi:MFS family permease